MHRHKSNLVELLFSAPHTAVSMAVHGDPSSAVLYYSKPNVGEKSQTAWSILLYSRPSWSQPKHRIVEQALHYLRSCLIISLTKDPSLHFWSVLPVLLPTVVGLGLPYFLRNSIPLWPPFNRWDGIFFEERDHAVHFHRTVGSHRQTFLPEFCYGIWRTWLSIWMLTSVFGSDSFKSFSLHTNISITSKLILKISLSQFYEFTMSTCIWTLLLSFFVDRS